MKTDTPHQPSLVSIQKSTYTDIHLHSLLDPLGGLQQFIKKGEQVLLKTNLLIPSSPEKAVVTHPAFVQAIAEDILKIGAFPLIGDPPSGQFTKRRLEKAYEKSGLTRVAKNLGIELNYDTGVTKIDIPQGKKLKRTPICNYVLQADKIIALPKIKTHSYRATIVQHFAAGRFLPTTPRPRTFWMYFTACGT